ncbi:hypothetical protein SAMN05660860_01487 [Geoalkalibacter ferrihydriticus]|uniref:Uncharacterized protein n=2 Tax=Geoalkalibacter ferrihydriticus TaxID=392333 RepID=A0A0C2ECV3_9BACT|nr:hypothetical protein [Geoalkalibacter ferrihydriticus]KIH76423.1 hypothetical protein GFER_09370 [Geoalkalibacter ferrihydriticus DSM 17813]SDL94048.1 hypothetical protein SAMN05660860_01487 [Geoalkalibacter ferrihydriticus]
MRKERFDYLCQEAQSGNDAFASHPGNHEEGRVLSCSPDHLVVLTSSGDQRCWDFSECEEVSRTKEEFPYR